MAGEDAGGDAQRRCASRRGRSTTPPGAARMGWNPWWGSLSLGDRARPERGLDSADRELHGLSLIRRQGPRERRLSRGRNRLALAAQLRQTRLNVERLAGEL